MATAKALVEREGTLALTPNGQRYLRQLMEEQGRTVSALAVELGISRKHLSNVLNGRVPLIPPLLGQVCRMLSADEGLVGALRDRGRIADPAPHGFLRGWVVAHGDLTEPMTDWEALET